VTAQVNLRYGLVGQSDYDQEWNGAKFMGFPKGEGRFLPVEPID